MTVESKSFLARATASPVKASKTFDDVEPLFKKKLKLGLPLGDFKDAKIVHGDSGDVYLSVTTKLPNFFYFGEITGALKFISKTGQFKLPDPRGIEFAVKGNLLTIDIRVEKSPFFK